MVGDSDFKQFEIGKIQEFIYKAFIDKVFTLYSTIHFHSQFSITIQIAEHFRLKWLLKILQNFVAIWRPGAALQQNGLSTKFQLWMKIQ